MAEIAITNVINISVSQAQAGAGEYNTSNLAVFTDEAFAESFGDLGYKIYLSPKEVGEDFGTESKTYAMANKIFSQQPNILAGNGYLVVIPFVTSVQTMGLSGVPASGSFTLQFAGGTTAAIQWNDTASAIQTKIRAVTGMENAVVTGSLASQSIVVSVHAYGPQTLAIAGGAGLQTSAPAAITVTPVATVVGESYAAAITRSESLVQYFGLMADQIFSESVMLAAAAVIQPLNKIGAFVSRTPADFAPGGAMDKLRTGGYDHSRGLYYGEDEVIDSLGMMAAYMGRGLSVNFSGSNTTINMNLKDLTGVQPDLTINQTYLNQMQAAGVDCYPSIQGIPKVYCSGANRFFDQVYNEQWFVGALQIAGFNYLATVATKIPQTEPGMDGLKGAYRDVCEQAITNQYGAPGKWTRPDTFGNQVNFLANIEQVGYYIYSIPVAKQSAADREARKAPLVQIALKEAGAINSSNVIVNINA